MSRRLGSLIVLALALSISVACAAPGYKFKGHEVRGATKFLNRAGSAAQPYVEGVCTPVQEQLKSFCKVLRNLYRGTLAMADGIDEALNRADEQGTQDVDIAKLLDAGFKVLDIVTEEEAVTRQAMADSTRTTTHEKERRNNVLSTP